MVSKRVGGDEARRQGASPSGAQVTTGAPEGREHLPHKARSEQRQRSADRGQRDVDKGPSRR